MVASMNSSPKACKQSGAESLAASGTAVEVLFMIILNLFKYLIVCGISNVL